MAKSLGYKPAPMKAKNIGGLKMKAGKHGAIGSKPAGEKPTEMHAATYMSKIIADMRKKGKKFGTKQPKRSGSYAS